jgi:hypothetical protein
MTTRSVVKWSGVASGLLAAILWFYSAWYSLLAVDAVLCDVAAARYVGYLNALAAAFTAVSVASSAIDSSWEQLVRRWMRH